MAAPALKLPEIAIFPPAFDLLEAMRAVETLKQLQYVIDDGETQLLAWRLSTQQKLRAGMDMVDAAFARVDDRRNLPADVLAPLEVALQRADELLEVYSRPFMDRPDVAATFKRLEKLGGPGGRFIRRQVKRIEDLRIAQYNAILDMVLALRGFRSEHGPEAEIVGTFDDPQSLGAFLRSRAAK